MKIGDKIDGKAVYGKGCKLVGEVISIVHHEAEGPYVLNDVVTIRWNDGQIAKFHRGDIRE